MNRQERENLRDRLQTEIAETLDDMTARRAYRRDEPDEWQLPASSSQPKPQRNGMTDAQILRMVHDVVTAKLETAIDVLGEEAGLVEKTILQCQDNELATLRSEMQSMRSEISELRNMIGDLQGEVAALADDVIDRGGVTTLHKRGGHAA
jgi:phosphoribosylpyrophosphate synthetase